MGKKTTQKNLKTGYTTGTCAAAAALAAAEMITNNKYPQKVSLVLPGGEEAIIEVEDLHSNPDSAIASVRKYAGDDPDITNNALISCDLKPLLDNSATENIFHAGKGVGVITRPGLQLPVGEAAINPVPRQMINKAISTITTNKFEVTISVENGEELAQKTFNPRLGITGGISIIGTSGIVRPFSHQALREALNCSLSVAAEDLRKYPPEQRTIILVPGHYGYNHARKLFGITNTAIVEVSNEWGFALRQLAQRGFTNCIAVGHPGKLAKLPAGYDNTHSKESPPALEYVKYCAKLLGINNDDNSTTVDGFFTDLPPAKVQELGCNLAKKISTAMQKLASIPCTVILINMQGQTLGSYGDAP